MIVKNDGKPIPKSLGPSGGSNRKYYELQESAREIVRKNDETYAWDSMQAKDIQPELLNFVKQSLDNGFEPCEIRRQLKILRSTDKSWRKIQSALKAGYRIDGMSYLLQVTRKFSALSNKHYELITNAIEEGVPCVDDKGRPIATPDGEPLKVRMITKEMAQNIDAWSRAQQAIVKIAKDLGAYVENDASKSGQGVTIVLQNNVKLPSQAEIDAHRAGQVKKSQDIIVEAQAQHEVRQSQAQLPPK